MMPLFFLNRSISTFALVNVYHLTKNVHAIHVFIEWKKKRPEAWYSLQSKLNNSIGKSALYSHLFFDGDGVHRLTERWGCPYLSKYDHGTLFRVVLFEEPWNWLTERLTQSTVLDEKRQPTEWKLGLRVLQRPDVRSQHLGKGGKTTITPPRYLVGTRKPGLSLNRFFICE